MIIAAAQLHPQHVGIKAYVGVHVIRQVPLRVVLSALSEQAIEKPAAQQRLAMGLVPNLRPVILQE